MEEWVQSLYQLIQYWKARKQADLATHMAVKQANHKLVPLHDVYHEANEQPYQETMALFMNEVEEVEEARTIANSQIWNMCTVSGCRSILVCIEKKIPSSAALSINGAFFGFSLCDLHCKQYADYSYLAL